MDTPKKFQERTLQKILLFKLCHVVANDGNVKDLVLKIMPNIFGAEIKQVANEPTTRILEIDCGDFMLNYRLVCENRVETRTYLIKNIISI